MNKKIIFLIYHKLNRQEFETDISTMSGYQDIVKVNFYFHNLKISQFKKDDI